MTRPVRLASIGLGWWGKVLAEAANRSGEAKIVSCYARGAEGRAAFADQLGCRAAGSLEEVLTDPEVDGVLVATSHRSHRDLIERAAAAGKGVFVEKPLTTNVADAVAAVEAAERAGIPLQVGHQRRRTAADRHIRRLIDAGRMGDIEALDAVHSVPNGFRMPDTAWRWDPEESPLGSMTSLGIHKIDSMQYHAGPIRSVFCFTRAGREHPIDEATVLALEFESGAVGTLVTSFFSAVCSELAVHGQNASAYNLADGARLQIQVRGEATREEVELEAADPVVDQLQEFARAIRGETAPEVDGRVALHVVEVLEAAMVSARERRAVDITAVR